MILLKLVSVSVYFGNEKFLQCILIYRLKAIYEKFSFINSLIDSFLPI